MHESEEAKFTRKLSEDANKELGTQADGGSWAGCAVLFINLHPIRQIEGIGIFVSNRNRKEDSDCAPFLFVT